MAGSCLHLHKSTVPGDAHPPTQLDEKCHPMLSAQHIVPLPLCPPPCHPRDPPSSPAQAHLHSAPAHRVQPLPVAPPPAAPAAGPASPSPPERGQQHGRRCSRTGKVPLRSAPPPAAVCDPTGGQPLRQGAGTPSCGSINCGTSAQHLTRCRCHSQNLPAPPAGRPPYLAEQHLGEVPQLQVCLRGVCPGCVGSGWGAGVRTQQWLAVRE